MCLQALSLTEPKPQNILWKQFTKNTPKGDKCCDPWHARGLEYNYYATPRIHLMRVYGTCVIRLIHHYACECIIKELGASILGAIHHEQAGAGCWAVQNKVNCKGLYARKLDTLQTIVLITLVEQNNTRGGTTICWMLKMEKKHYMTLRRTISHFSPFYRWIVTWGASAILTPRQHNTTKKWNCPARLEWFEPTTNFIFLLSLVFALVSGYDDNNIILRSLYMKSNWTQHPQWLCGGCTLKDWN